MARKFNIRIYGLLRKEGKVLVADEIRKGQRMLKFPGGGLEWGEGVLDTLERELREELGIEEISATHFYTTEFFQQSAFREEDQLIAIYYLVESYQPLLRERMSEDEDHHLEFKWVDIDDKLIDMLTFPVDTFVGELLVRHHQST